MSQNQNNSEPMSPSELIRKAKSNLVISILIFIISGFYTIYKYIQIFYSDSGEPFNAEFDILAFLFIIAVLAFVTSFTQILRFIGELISLNKKQKGKERKKIEIQYNLPNEASQIYLKKISSKGIYYFSSMIILSVIFMIFYIFIDTKYDNTILSLMHYEDNEEQTLPMDLFVFLAFFSFIILALFFIALFQYLKQKKKKKAKSKDSHKFKFGTFQPFDFRKEQSKNIKKFSIESKNSEEPFDMENKVSNINFQYGFCLIYALSYVLGMPIKIFIPLYVKYKLIEVSLVINVLNFTFYGIFLIYLFLILREVVPAWRIFKKYRVIIKQ